MKAFIGFVYLWYIPLTSMVYIPIKTINNKNNKYYAFLILIILHKKVYNKLFFIKNTKTNIILII
jgi:hypothetical protein